MARDIKITRITTTHFDCEIADMELEEQLGFDTVYRKGGRLAQNGGILTIETSAGVSGIAPNGIDPRTAQYLLGSQPAGPRDHLATISSARGAAKTAHHRVRWTPRYGILLASSTTRRFTSFWAGVGARSCRPTPRRTTATKTVV